MKMYTGGYFLPDSVYIRWIFLPSFKWQSVSETSDVCC